MCVHTKMNLYPNISHHPRLIAAYHKGLNDLLESKGPNGTKLIVEDGVPWIVDANDKKIMSIRHYALDELGGNPRTNPYEEAFAEIVANTTDPLRNLQKSNIHLATYFPDLHEEIQNILNGLDMAYGNTPSSPEVPVDSLPRPRPRPHSLR